MRIAIDIDSTLHHYWDQLSEAARHRFGIALPYEDQVTCGITLLRPEQVRACVQPASHDVTERWLKQIELPYDELYCSYDKIARCREIGIDDSPVLA